MSEKYGSGHPPVLPYALLETIPAPKAPPRASWPRLPGSALGLTLLVVAGRKPPTRPLALPLLQQLFAVTRVLRPDGPHEGDPSAKDESERSNEQRGTPRGPVWKLKHGDTPSDLERPTGSQAASTALPGALR